MIVCLSERPHPCPACGLGHNYSIDGVCQRCHENGRMIPAPQAIPTLAENVARVRAERAARIAEAGYSMPSDWNPGDEAMYGNRKVWLVRKSANFSSDWLCSEDPNDKTNWTRGITESKLRRPESAPAVVTREGGEVRITCPFPSNASGIRRDFEPGGLTGDSIW